MTAKEMFEKLGYKLIENVWNKNLITYKYIQYELDFDLVDKSYLFGEDEVEYWGSASIDLALHQAIVKQMKELGWIE